MEVIESISINTKKTITNANDILFRCSSLGHIMTEPKSKSDILSAGCKTHLVDLFVSSMYSRREEIFSKFLTKGNAREEDAITLLSRLTGNFYKKNTVRLNNSFITGECDAFIGDEVTKAEETTDTKTSWSAHTFFRAITKPLDDSYKWQGVGYMALTGARKHNVAYCLVNGTDDAIRAEKLKAGYQLGMMDAHGNPTEKYLELCRQIEINHIFDLEAFRKEYPYFEFDNDLTQWRYDIPKEKRLFIFTIERNDAEIEAVYKKVMQCRAYMNANFFGK